MSHFLASQGLKWNKTRGVCHIVALLFTLKNILRQKTEELWKLKYFSMQ
jgi:hypothetical protein